MNLNGFSWNDNSRKIPKDAHALFGASKYHWINYSEDKMIELYTNSQAKKIGTELHETARLLIKNKIKLPDVDKTLNMYVNDAIFYGMEPEKQLYYSDLFFGTADAISVEENEILRIHDLKTGKTPASMHQLEIYTAFFFLEYADQFIMEDFSDVELRIYQSDDIQTSHPSPDIIYPIMDKIVTVNKIIQRLKGDRNERYLPFGSST